jgi:membrane-associated protease RseP (regulator of RpoE activity)
MIILFTILFTIIIITAHELAHLLAAKSVGCEVLVYSIGFGKPFYSFYIGNTRYNIAPILLGGYCEVKGEGELNPDKDAFCNLSYRKKFFLISAGCLCNIIMGIVPYLLGLKWESFWLYYFGYLSIGLGASNLCPIPCLDGSYLIFVWIEKLFGKEKGQYYLNKIMKTGFVVLIILNILAGLWMAYYYRIELVYWTNCYWNIIIDFIGRIL